MVGGGDGSPDEWPHPEDPLQQAWQHKSDISKKIESILIPLAAPSTKLWAYI
jgi:hypothetical protein